MKTEHYEPGAVIIQQGSEGDHFYIVSKGTVEITLQRPNAADVVVAQLGEGQYFGEMELLHGHGRAASVRASEHMPVEVLALDYETLSSLMSESEATFEALSRTATERQQQNKKFLGD